MPVRNCQLKHFWIVPISLAYLPFSAMAAASASDDSAISTRTIVERTDTAIADNTSTDKTPTISALTQDQVLSRITSYSPIERTRSLTFGETEPAEEKRRIRSEVSVSVGTGGYRSGYISTLIPLGDNGMLGIAIGQTDYGKNNVGYGYYPYDYSPYGYDYSTHVMRRSLDMSGRYMFPQADGSDRCSSADMISGQRRGNRTTERCDLTD
ncbi:MAG: hypothetical protein QM645_08395 [Asticcacaulis sp.]